MHFVISGTWGPTDLTRAGGVRKQTDPRPRTGTVNSLKVAMGEALGFLLLQQPQCGSDLPMRVDNVPSRIRLLQRKNIDALTVNGRSRVLKLVDQANW